MVEIKDRQERVVVKIGEVYTTDQLFALKQQQYKEKQRKNRELKQAREEKKRKREEKKHELLQRKELAKNKRLQQKNKKKQKTQSKLAQGITEQCRMCLSKDSEGGYWYVCSICGSFRVCVCCQKTYKIFRTHR